MGRRPSPSRILTLGVALGAVACSKSTKPGDAGSAGVAPAASLVAKPVGSHTAPAASDADPWEGHPPRPPRPPPPGASATALRSDFRARLTTVHVSAHAGAVILRKRGTSWVTGGDAGCTVPARRIDWALDELAQLKAVKTDEQPADGRAFELQIVALMGEDIALQLEIAGRGDGGDLVQLYDGSRVRMRGLDRRLWSPRPADWCKAP